MKRIKAITTTVALVLAFGATAGGAVAAWSKSSSGSSSAKARGLTPASGVGATAVNQNVTVTWTDGSNPAGTNYVVVRNSVPPVTLSCTASPCSDTGAPAGTYNYSVAARLHGWTSSTAVSNNVTVAAAPSATVTFPSEGASINGNNAWNNKCPSSGTGICGTSTSATRVDVVLKRAVGTAVTYWSGTAWVSTAQTVQAAGTTEWLLGITFLQLRDGISQGTSASYEATVTPSNSISTGTAVTRRFTST